MAGSTVRIVSAHPESQGPFVILDAKQFDPSVHRLYDPEPAAQPAEASSPVSVDPEPLLVPERRRRKT